MQLPGRCWREGRAAPSDSSGEEDAQREQLNYSQGIKGTGTRSLQPPASALGFSPSCLPGLARHLHPPKNHRDEFLRGPSVSKPAAEGRVTFLPLLLHAALWPPHKNTFQHPDSVMDGGPEQGICPGGSLAWEQPGRGAWQ